MTKINRRTAVTMALASGMTITTAQAEPGMSVQEKGDEELGAPSKDESYVMEAGMTREEANCWSKVAEAAAAFFALPEQHPLDKQEVVTAVHVIQNKLLSRPTYRKYIELAKAGYEAEQEAKNDKNDKQEQSDKK